MRLHPNVLTFLSLLSSVLFFIFVLNGMYVLAFIALLGAVLDAIDGYVARATKKASRFGGFLDATFDRISDFFYISAFGFAGLVAWEIVVVTLFTTFLVSYLRARGEATLGAKMTINNGLMQRSGRVFLIGLSFLVFFLMPDFSFYTHNIFTIIFIFMALVNVVTIGQRMLFVYSSALDK